MHSPKIDSYKVDPKISEVADRSMLVGSWYGEQSTKDGLLRKSLVIRKKNGAFTAHFQLFDKEKKVTEAVESGYWGLSGNIYFTVTREFLKGEKFEPFDTTDASYYDAYVMMEIKSDSNRYKAVSSDNVFESKKVSDSFRLNR